MLVLSRKIGEGIVLPETGVRIAVLGIRGKRVRIGIEGPKGASAYREEVWEQMLCESEPGTQHAPVEEPACESAAA